MNTNVFYQVFLGNVSCLPFLKGHNKAPPRGTNARIQEVQEYHFPLKIGKGFEL
jgi:hypothetical protein